MCVRKYSDSPSDYRLCDWEQCYENEAAEDDIKEQEQKANDLVVSVLASVRPTVAYCKIKIVS